MSLHDGGSWREAIDILKRTNRKRIYGPRGLGLVAVAVLVAAACGPRSTEGSDLSDLQLIGVDFELNSIIISNNGTTDVRTEGLWAYRDGQGFEFDIFTIEPRATILFSMREMGEISADGGEIALASSDDFENPNALLDYVAWGSRGFDLTETATEAGLWPEDESVVTDVDTIVLLRTNPTGTGPAAWQASEEVG